MDTLIFHEYTVQVIGPKGHHYVINNSFKSQDDDEAKCQAIQRASQIINGAEFSSIKFFNSFDVVIDYVKTEIITTKYSFKNGDFQ